MKKLTREEYVQEIDGEFLDIGDALIPNTLLMEAVTDRKPEGRLRYFMGVDVARSGRDETVFTITSVDERDNVFVEEVIGEAQSNVVDVAGSVEGVFIGVTHQLWYSRKKQSTDLFFYVTDKGRGWGSSLLRAYIRWARMNKGVAEITLGITSGIGDMNRTRQLYERMGAIKMGDSFILPKEV